MSTSTKYPTATTVTIYSLGFFLGAFHILLGVIALTPLISQDYHREIKINYNAFSKTLFNALFLHELVDRATLAFFLRYAISLSQAVFGTFLLENGHYGSLGKIGNIGLIVADLVFFLLQVSVGTAYERMAPTLVFSLLLITRLVIIEQASKKTKVGVRTRNAGKPKTSTPKKNKNE